METISPVEKIVPRKLDLLQCGRAIAAISVAGFHAAERMNKHGFHGAAPDLFRFGNLGVDLFFVISGFIIFFIHAKDIGRPHRLATYAYRRATRIYPLYWILFALVVPLYFVFPSAGDGTARDPASILRCLLLLPNHTGQIIGVAWTLVYEISFYAIFALLILGGRWGMVVVAAWGLMVVTSRLGHRVDLGYFNAFFGLRFIEFAIGAAVFYASRRFVPRGGMIIAACGLAVLFLGGLVWRPLGQALSVDPSRIVLAGLLSGVVIFGLVVADMRAVGARTSSALAAPLIALGDASYSIYLFHWLIGWALDKVFMKLGAGAAGGLLLFPVMLAAMILGGYLVHITLEKRLMAIFARWGRQLLPVPVAKPTPA